MDRRLMMLAATLAVAFGAVADTWKDPDTGYTWTYRISSGTAEIYNGRAAAISPTTTGAVTIPSTRGGKPVTGIGSYAFSGCYIKRVTIPDSVTSIGAYAFVYCSNVANITYLSDCPAYATDDIYHLCPSLRTYVSRYASGWDAALAAGTWKESPIAYMDAAQDIRR